jgi:hypothetical protein
MKPKNDQIKKTKISNGYRRYVRQEKAKIRKEVFDSEEQEKQIKELYNNLQKKQ